MTVKRGYRILMLQSHKPVDEMTKEERKKLKADALLERKPLEDEIAAMEIPNEQRLGIINVEYMNLSNMVKAVDDIEEEEKPKVKPWAKVINDKG